MKKIIFSWTLVMLVVGVMAQTHTATQHRSTESIRLQDVTVTDIVDTVSDQSTDSELPTAKAVYDALGSGTNIGVEFEYNVTLNLIPAGGQGFFRNDSIILYEIDRRGISVADAIDGAIKIKVRNEDSYIEYSILEIKYNAVNDYYHIQLDLGKGSLPEPLGSSVRYLTFEKSNISTPPNDTTVDAGLLGFEFQYTKSANKTPTAGTIDIGADTIQLWKKDKRGILISGVVPTASHVRVRNDSLMIAYEIISYELIADNYYRILINTSKGTPDEPSEENITFVSFIFSTGTSTGLEKITEGGNTGWAMIGDDRSNKLPIGDGSFDLTTTHFAGNYGASGYNSFAVGEYNLASGGRATATGWRTVASSYESFASGTGTIASGKASFVMNERSRASGRASFCGGYTASDDQPFIVSGDGAFGFQYNYGEGTNYVAASYSVVLGGKNNSTGSGAIGSAVIGGNSIEATQEYTTYVDRLRITPKTAPLSPEEGTLYSKDSDNNLYYYDGTSWVDLTASASGISNVNDADDWNTSGITDWSVPKWSSSTGKWIMDVDSTAAGASSDYQVKLNAGDASPGYLDAKLTAGDLITLSTVSGAKEINVAKATLADVSANSVVDKAVTPDVLPTYGIYDLPTQTFTTLTPPNTIMYDAGLVMRKTIVGSELQVGYGLATGSLPIKSYLNIDFNDYVIINTDIDETVRMTIGGLYNLLQATQLEMDVSPSAVFNLVDHPSGWTNGAAFTSFSFGRMITITEWDGTTVSSASGSITFENENNCSGSMGSFSDVNNPTIAITVDAGTFLNNGTRYGSVDVVFTHTTTGVSVRKKIYINHNGDPIY